MPQGFWKKKGRAGKYWYTRLRLPDGRTVARSTGCIDLAAARAWRREQERRLVAEGDAAQDEAPPYPLGQAIADFKADLRRRGRAEGTIQMHNTKGGHLMRLLGKYTDVNSLTRADVHAYVDTRLQEGASHHTVKKEMTCFNGTMKLAIKEGHCRLRFGEVKVDGISAKYQPKDRRLSEKDLQKLEAEFAHQPYRAKHIRFLVLSGACWGESVRCERRDVDLDSGYLYLPGTKRETRRRRLPIKHLPELQALLADILAEMPADQTRLFRKWDNVRRALHAACKRAEIDPVSPNDLRRTFGSWLKNRGLDSAVIARLMGHSSTRMVDLVYGKLDDETLADAMGSLQDVELGELPGAEDATEEQEVAQEAAAVGAGSGSKYGSSGMDSEAVSATSETTPPDDSATGSRKPPSTTTRNLCRKQSTPATCATGVDLPRDRIELPTRGFSVPCSTG